MRVLLIDVNCKYSSTGKIVYDLFQRLKTNGHDAAICYGRGEKIEEVGIYKFGIDLETYVHAGLARVTGRNGCYSFFSTLKLMRFIDEFKPDVIHIHELHAYFVNISQLISHIKKKGVKVIWTFHCEFMYTGKCGHAYECLNFHNGCGKCPALKEYPKSLFFDRTKKMFRDKYDMLRDWDFTITTPSKWLADRVRMSFLKDKKIKVIHNGVDTKVFFQRKQEEIEKLREQYGLKGKKVVLSIAPDIMSKRKGGSDIVKLAFTMPQYEFVLIGAELSELLNRDNVHILPLIKNKDELAVWYTMAEIFVICSERETFSMTCAEALCCGTRVVGYKCGAPETVFVAPYAVFVDRNREMLKDAINRMLSVDMNKEQIANDARNMYSDSSMYNAYLEQYLLLVKGEDEK